MRIVFMGTPGFAVPCLKEMLVQGYDVAAAVTQPDRAKGRGKKLALSPVKVLAEESGIPVYQPEKIKTEEFTGVLRDLEPDVIIVVAFGQILSREILSIPPLGCINVHASLLPKYRGAAPINWCIINGEKTTGVTTIYMDEGLDTGDIIIRKEIAIGENETAGELHDRMSELGASALSDTLKLLMEGKAGRFPQNDSEASYAPIMNKALGRINWAKSAEEIRNLIRGTYPWPGAFSSYNGKIFKIFKSTTLKDEVWNEDHGLIRRVERDGIVVGCGTGSLRIEELQFENEKRMSAEAYLRGHSIEENVKLE
ncbi:MAG TPA: methionyl-tRNA formyltransferase [Bacillota bacterium]|nr:methionyl-tRNA formyltransferase [Bacillota bacterium]HOR86205.1 methionyl-tRNA formyltransferase [Bacillota bacterium]HPL53831.1 methionyl-tRNA formyltransferase [Bacillota bacterium]